MGSFRFDKLTLNWMDFHYMDIGLFMDINIIKFVKRIVLSPDSVKSICSINGDLCLLTLSSTNKSFRNCIDWKKCTLIFGRSRTIETNNYFTNIINWISCRKPIDNKFRCDVVDYIDVALTYIESIETLKEIIMTDLVETFNYEYDSYHNVLIINMCRIYDITKMKTLSLFMECLVNNCINQMTHPHMRNICVTCYVNSAVRYKYGWGALTDHVEYIFFMDWYADNTIISPGDNKSKLTWIYNGFSHNEKLRYIGVESAHRCTKIERTRVLR